ncbi:pumilio homology domain family member 4-like isoform X2 [Salvia miltiorrhiza]|nr:pumilio homology domain family member 4-like isoform X2 [Salvia miltiorrhiza]XP_057803041.1 pumilio homology domain family member 4-like isoform X2 [Salvia miltiorrhiza]XP_057803047.1 pumilio homology domain family member 4-like isoform X2 [Salvia miltiorrhiza]
MLNNATNHQQHHNNLVDHGYGHASCVSQKMNGHLRNDGGSDEASKRKSAFASSPVSGFSLQSGSSSSLFSGDGRSHSDIGSLSPPQFEDFKISGGGFCLDLTKANEGSLVDCFDLYRNFSSMCVRDEREGASAQPYGVQYCDQSPNRSSRTFDKYGVSDNYRSSFSVSVPRRGNVSFEGEAGSAMVEMPYDQRMASLLGSRYSPSQSDRMFCWSDFGSSAPGPQFHRHNGLANNSFPMGYMVPNASPSLDNPLVGDSLFYPPQSRKNPIEASDSFYSSNMAHMAQLSPHYNEDSLIHYQQTAPNGRNKVPLRVRGPRGSVEPFGREDSLIIQGEGVNYAITRHARLGEHNTKSFHHENGAWKTHERRSQLDDHLHTAAIQDGCQSPKMHCSFNRPTKFSSLAEAQGYIYHIAKDQQGCRFLQRMFDEGTSIDVQIIFNEIIDHAVELMMNPFGNYLMQKLLEVCNEEQRMHILFRVTEEEGELVRISLNTHGTRVVQKLIETLKTKQQISLVISALESGFLSLIKDLNGNHVIQRCLQCFPGEDSKFIFVAAAKYCVDIATHQHGCCVLQRCISHSTGEHRENLVAEISANGLLLAEDAFGNYVVQFILELKIPSATSKLTSQFEGNYVHLSSQKFSSHVVEKCLLVCNEEARTKIIHELLSAPCFDQLLQDPHANYVVQTALRVSEGHLHNSLVDAIESYKAVSRNSPYSKRIFSQKLLKR